MESEGTLICVGRIEQDQRRRKSSRASAGRRRPAAGRTHLGGSRYQRRVAGGGGGGDRRAVKKTQRPLVASFRGPPGLIAAGLVCIRRRVPGKPPGRAHVCAATRRGKLLGPIRGCTPGTAESNIPARHALGAKWPVVFRFGRISLRFGDPRMTG